MAGLSVGIMQPYFCPYLGYFQLIDAVDTFVVYDNIEYTKKGWINRNRILLNGQDKLFSLPLKKASDYEHICNRRLADTYPDQRRKLLAQISSAYRKAPFFDETFPLVERIFYYEEENLFQYLFHSLQCLCKALGIATELVSSSSLPVDHSLRGQDRVIDICKYLEGDIYINAPGGRELYREEDFIAEGIALKFLQRGDISYDQFGDGFVPGLSIIDVLMFNGSNAVRRLLKMYELS